MLEQTPKGLCLISLSPFPFTLSPPPPKPNPCETATLRALSSVGGTNLRKEAGGGNPSIRRRGDQVSSQCSSKPKGPPSFGCTRLGLSVEGGLGSGDCGFSQRGQTRQVQWGLISWLILSSSLSLRTVQPWDPRLLRLQGCESSPHHRGLGGMLLAFRCIFKINVHSALEHSCFTMLCWF